MASTLERVLRARTLSATGDGRRQREAAGLTLRYVAREVGVAHTTLAKWEAGQAPRRFSPGLLRWEAFLRRLEAAHPGAVAS